VLALLIIALLGMGPAFGQSLRAAPPEKQATATVIPFPPGWTLQEGSFSVTGGPPTDLSSIRKVSAYVEDAVPRITRTLGLPSDHRVRVYVTPTREQFNTLQPNRPPAWAEATAWPAASMVFVESPGLKPDASFEKVLDHELTHVIVGQAFLPRTPPRWLHEGLAQWVAHEYTPEMTRRIARGMLGNQLITLQDLTAGFPADPLKAQLAYAESADFVAWIANEYGEGALQAMSQEMAHGATAAAAIRHATGTGLDEADRAWRAHLSGSKLWIAGLFDSEIWWFLAAVGMVVGALGVRRRNRARRDAMAREEAFQDAMQCLVVQMQLLDRERAWDNEQGRWITLASHPEPPEEPVERLPH